MDQNGEMILIKYWNGTVKRLQHDESIKKNRRVRFALVFNYSLTAPDSALVGLNEARLFSLKATNVKYIGATRCEPCVDESTRYFLSLFCV